MDSERGSFYGLSFSNDSVEGMQSHNLEQESHYADALSNRANYICPRMLTWIMIQQSPS